MAERDKEGEWVCEREGIGAVGECTAERELWDLSAFVLGTGDELRVRCGDGEAVSSSGIISLKLGRRERDLSCCRRECDERMELDRSVYGEDLTRIYKRHNKLTMGWATISQTVMQRVPELLKIMCSRVWHRRIEPGGFELRCGDQ